MSEAVITKFPKQKYSTWDAGVGRNVKRLLIGRATQAQLAAVLGIKQPELSKRMNGKTRWLGEELAKIADALEVPVSELYTLDYGSEGSVIEVDFTSRRTA